MKNKLSLAANVLLVTAVAWMYVDHRAESRDLLRLCARADETYIHLLAASLEALEPVESEEAEKIKSALRPLVAVGLENIELRKAVGAPR
ncbi:MAG: hypothetical protein ACJA2W_001320 [Planctomycetota bacterium]|jgi:hypothetical protein